MAPRTRAARAAAALLPLAALLLCHAAAAASSLLTSAGAATLAAAWPDAAPAAAPAAWPRGGRRACGSLRTPGASFGGRADETDHCFPASASDHYVCCVAIRAVANARNEADASVARHNPLEGPITRNSADADNLSWCVCSVSICVNQLNGTVAWVGRPGDT
jgi:hypothetical protein